MRTRFAAAPMVDVASPFHYQLECSPVSATFHLGGDRCTRANLQHLALLARKLPEGMRTLRIDLHGVATLEVGVLIELHLLLGDWRTMRGGVIRIASPPQTMRSIGSAAATSVAICPDCASAMTHDDKSVWHCGECGYSALPRRERAFAAHHGSRASAWIV
jgi:ribosomal protein S27AE